MDEIFKKIRDFESKDSHLYADWDSLEKALDKRDRRIFLWIFPVLVSTLLFFLIWSEGTKMSRENVNRQVGTSVIDNDRITMANNDEVIELSIPNMDGRIETETSRYQKSNTTDKVNVDRALVSNDAEVDSFNKLERKISSNNLTSLNSFNSAQTSPLVAVNFQESIESSIVERKEEENRSVEQEELITENSIEEDGSEDESALTVLDEKEEVLPIDQEAVKPFGLDAGLRLSALNGVSNLNDQLAYGLGAFLKFDYNFNRRLGLSFSAGIGSEFNHNLEYVYLAERNVFVKRSDRFVRLNTKQLYSSELSLALNYNWNKKLTTSLGVFYNTVLQSVTELSEYGTGIFENLNNSVERKTGYTDLMNQHEFGINLAQTYRFNNSWGLTMSFYKGLSNRVSKDYFSNYGNKRMQLSLTITRKIL